MRDAIPTGQTLLRNRGHPPVKGEKVSCDYAGTKDR